MLLNRRFLYKTYLNGAGAKELMSVPPLPAGERKYADFDKMLAGLVAELERLWRSTHCHDCSQSRRGRIGE